MQNFGLTFRVCFVYDQRPSVEKMCSLGLRCLLWLKATVAKTVVYMNFLATRVIDPILIQDMVIEVNKMNGRNMEIAVRDNDLGRFNSPLPN